MLMRFPWIVKDDVSTVCCVWKLVNVTFDIRQQVLQPGDSFYFSIPQSDTKLFGRLTNPAHCFHSILPSYNKSHRQ